MARDAYGSVRPVGSSASGTPPITREQMVKPLDAWWTVLFVDPVATRIVPPLSRVSWVTPTAITLLAHLLGVVSALLFASDRIVVAAAVYEVRFVLDCVDGKLARVTGRSSLFGQLLDTWGDRVLFLANAAALGWQHAPIAVVVLAAAYPLQFHLLQARREVLARGGSDRPLDRMLERGWGRALARRRMFPMPTSVDVEHLLLFGGPVAWGLGLDALAPLLWLVTAYAVLECTRYGASMLRTAAALDRAAAAATSEPAPAAET